MLNIVVTAILAFVAWIAMSIVDLKTETAVINQKVSENHKMLTVLWDDFLEKKMAISRGSLANQISKPPQKRKWSKKRKAKINCKRPRGFSEKSTLCREKETKECLKMHVIKKLNADIRSFPSAYASGAIAKCRKVGAANWGNKSKKKAKGGTYKYKTTSIY